MPKIIYPHKNTKWLYRFMDSAHFHSGWSKDPSTKVGAVLMRDRRALVEGYNGFPEGIEDTEERLNDRELKYPLTIHAEMNVIYNAAKFGVPLQGSWLFVYGLPICDVCALGIIQTGISTVVEPLYGFVPPIWEEKNRKKEKLFAEAGVEILKLAKYSPPGINNSNTMIWR